MVECLDDSDGIVDSPGEDYFAAILTEFLSSCDPPRGLVGRAPSELLNAGELVTFAAAWMTARLSGSK